MTYIQNSFCQKKNQVMEHFGPPSLGVCIAPFDIMYLFLPRLFCLLVPPVNFQTHMHTITSSRESLEF